MLRTRIYQQQPVWSSTALNAAPTTACETFYCQRTHSLSLSLPLSRKSEKEIAFGDLTRSHTLSHSLLVSLGRHPGRQAGSQAGRLQGRSAAVAGPDRPHGSFCAAGANTLEHHYAAARPCCSTWLWKTLTAWSYKTRSRSKYFLSLGSVQAVASAAFSSALNMPLPFFFPILRDPFTSNDDGRRDGEGTEYRQRGVDDKCGTTFSVSETVRT